MKIFMDTANVEEIKQYVDWGVVYGVTTNPSLIAKSGRTQAEVIPEIAALVSGQQAAQTGNALCHIGLLPFPKIKILPERDGCPSQATSAAVIVSHHTSSHTGSSIGKTKTPPAPTRAQEAYNYAVPLLHSLMPARQPDSPITAATPGAITPRAPGCTSQLPPWARLQPVARPLCPLVELLLFPFLAQFGLP